MSTGRNYPVNTLADMAAIPVEDRPRFLAELPAMLDALKQIQEAADAMAERALWPWPLSLLPESFRRRVVSRAIRRPQFVSFTWTDDDKGLVSVSVEVAGETVFNETRRMNPSA